MAKLAAMAKLYCCQKQFFSVTILATLAIFNVLIAAAKIAEIVISWQFSAISPIAQNAEQAEQAAQPMCTRCAFWVMLSCGGDPIPSPHQLPSQAHSTDSP